MSRVSLLFWYLLVLRASYSVSNSSINLCRIVNRPRQFAWAYKISATKIQLHFVANFCVHSPFQRLAMFGSLFLHGKYMHRRIVKLSFIVIGVVVIHLFDIEFYLIFYLLCVILVYLTTRFHRSGWLRFALTRPENKSRPEIEQEKGAAEENKKRKLWITHVWRRYNGATMRTRGLHHMHELSAGASFAMMCATIADDDGNDSGIDGSGVLLLSASNKTSIKSDDKRNKLKSMSRNTEQNIKKNTRTFVLCKCWPCFQSEGERYSDCICKR